ncbi:hypothetical protein [Brevibacterium album]|uniref:hypothetical protein n=1 Tax=Brevibacterium album TaxID=417948 RepID=UPI00041694DA|nr:hypothetical protein [Brevibacterium album]
MTVKRLIELLSDLNPSALVYIGNDQDEEASWNVDADFVSAPYPTAVVIEGWSAPEWRDE